ncbi:MAG: hypothetical protein WB774_02070 [Xanthobacteraceae bacterium]
MQDRAERPDKHSDAESRERDQKRFKIGLRRKEQPGDGGGKIAVDDEVEPFERIAERGRRDRTPALRLHGCRGVAGWRPQ